MDSNLIDKMKLNLDNNLINKKNKLNNDSSLKEVAQEFESLFVFQMLKSARKAKLADGILNNQAFETYQSLLTRIFKKTCWWTNFGIAEGLIRQFEKEILKNNT